MRTTLSVEYKYPFTPAAQTAINGMGRGDIVTYHYTHTENNQTVKEIEHSNVALGDVNGSCWGGNNVRAIFEGGEWKAQSPHVYAETTVYQYVNQLKQLFDATGFDYDDLYIVIHKKR